MIQCGRSEAVTCLIRATKLDTYIKTGVVNVFQVQPFGKERNV